MHFYGPNFPTFTFIALSALVLGGAQNIDQALSEDVAPSCDASTCSGESSPAVQAVVDYLEPAMEKCIQLDHETTEEFFLCVAMEKGAVAEDGSINYEGMGAVGMEVVNALLTSNETAPPPVCANNPFYSTKSANKNIYSCG